METADDRMHLLNTGNLLRLPYRIHNADMTTGADHHQTFAADVEAGGMLMYMLVRHDLALELGRREVAVRAAGALPAVVDETVGQHPLDTVAFDLAGRKGVARDYGRRLAQHRRHLVRVDLASNQRAILAQLSRRGPAEPMAEIVFTAGIQLEVGRKYAPVLAQEADQAAVMVDVAVADDQRLDLGRIR